MKKNPLVTFLKTPWAIPVFTIAGLIVGAALAFAAMRWVIPALMAQQTDQGIAEEMQEENEQEESFQKFQGDELTIDVTWDTQARRLSREEVRSLLKDAIKEETQQEVFEATFLTAVDEEGVGYAYGDGLEFTDIWEVGRVSGGLWKNAPVYHLRLAQHGLGVFYDHWYLIQPEQEVTAALIAIGEPPKEEYLNESSAVLLQGVTFFTRSVISGLQLPEQFTLENGTVITRSSYRTFSGEEYRFDLTEPLKQVARTTTGQAVYEYTEGGSGSRVGCLIVFAPDGEMFVYKTTMSAVRDEIGGIRPLVTWLPEYQGASGQTYIETLYGGCGAYACLAVVSDEEANAGGGLIIAGRAEDGTEVFVPQNPSEHPSVQTIYDAWYIPDGGEKLSVEAFLVQHPAPVFYWKDGLGRWIEYRSTAILPAAECGKPVIYLYPEQTTDISVRLPSFIDVTVSEPTYPSAGWHVTAQPNGQLTNHTDGNTYGSLYWEGTGVGYAPPKDGFIVKDGEVESFLRNTLPRYGLNQTETREFMEFWVPEMQGAPYYRVSFLTSAWSAAAPLFVSPQPQTSIRIFMDWRPLSAPVSLPEPKIATPARNGFTLVEWGGTLWK